MKRSIVSLAVAGAALAATPVFADNALVKFDGGIGVHPVGGINAGAPTSNTVLGVPPGGRPWAIRSLKATVNVDGSLSIRGSGLVFAGGDTIGTRGTVAQVGATLFCGGIAFDSPVADLDVAGNFSIRGALTPLPPSPCTAPVLLIRNAAGTRAWFAAGIPAVGDDD